MKCWICGDIAKTGEHLLKSSDLRSHYGRVTPAKPIYFHTKQKRNSPLLSVKDKRLVCRAKICAKCNNDRTQPYDRAWEAFSSNVRNNWRAISKKGKIDLAKIFPGSSRQQALNVHLYFIKLFGCRIVENSVPIDIAKFSDALLKATPHDEVYLIVSETPPTAYHKIAALTEMHARNVGSVTQKAAWIYTVGPLSMKVGYLSKDASEMPWPNSWHPSKPGKILKLAKLKY